MLEIDGLVASYGRIEVLHGVSLQVAEGEIVSIVGANGAGKTTLMKTVAGVHSAQAGRVRYRGRDITAAPAHQRVAEGIALVPEGRQVFGPLSVRDNLRLGAYRTGDRALVEEMETLFPILAERRHQPAGSLSGGQQQMLAIARALMAAPKLLFLDEPSMGLAPLIAEEIFQSLKERHRTRGLTVLLVEQNVAAALSMADRGYVLETGRVAAEGSASRLLADEAIQRAYLGH